jgi:zinc D-Ala-D-Ala carboxypeptidase
LRISKHISYKEATQSQTATRKGISNDPDAYQLQNMQLLAEKVFEPIREHFGVPIAINSFFRSQKLNKAIGGASGSQHTQGRAIDIDDTLGGVSNKQMFDYIKNHLDFDQLIWEFGDNNNPAWVHISYVSPTENRNRVLKASKKNGKTIYTIL